MDACDIIIPVWNEKKLTESCIERLRKNTNYPYRLIPPDETNNMAFIPRAKARGISVRD